MKKIIPQRCILAKLNTLIKFSIFSGICLIASQCRERPVHSTTYNSYNTPADDEINTTDHADLESNTDNEAAQKLPELASIAGLKESGKLYLRYNNHSKEMKKWTILAPYEVVLHASYIEVKFAGNYYIDGEPTGDGSKKLFIKKEDIKSILVSE